MPGNHHIPLVEVTRGNIVESVHYGSFSVVFSTGKPPLCTGDCESPFFLRSSAKPFQTLAFLEGGGADHFSLTEEEIALMCSSHSGTDQHVERLETLQEKIGVSEEMLQCGLHPPIDKDTELKMAAEKIPPRRNRHNCSGKHTGMLAFAKMIGAPLDDYLSPTHPVQKQILKTFAEMCAFPQEEIELGVDGCSAPVFAVPLPFAAQAYARMCAPGDDMDENRAAASRRITSSMSAHPFMVGGPNRFDTDLMAFGRELLVAKEGAEGYLTAGILPRGNGRNAGTGICIKISDGDPHRRASSLVCLTILQKLGLVPDTLPEPFDKLIIVNNWRGTDVGVLRPSAEFLDAIKDLAW